MSGEQRKRAAVAVVKVESRDDQVTPEASPEFVETGYVQDLSKRALAYLAVGCVAGALGGAFGPVLPVPAGPAKWTG